MDSLVERFSLLPPARKSEFIEKELKDLTREESIRFLKAIISLDLSPEQTVTVISRLSELGYHDNLFFKKFLFSRSDRVVRKAKEILKKDHIQPRDKIDECLNTLREGRDDDQKLMIKNVLDQEGEIDTDMLIAILKFDSLGLRHYLINKLEPRHRFDETRLAGFIEKGLVWYARAAIVEILGNRRSEHLFDVIDTLMKDRNVEVKLKLIRSLDCYEKEKVKGYLHALCRDDLIWVQREAKKVLSRL